MCPCHPEDNQITLALLAAAGILLAVVVLRRFWPTMTTALRVTVVAAGFVSLVCAAFALNRGGDPPETCPHHPPVAAPQAGAPVGVPYDEHAEIEPSESSDRL